MYVIWDPEAYNVWYPANSYSANLGGTKIINKGVIKLRIKQKKGREKKYNNTQKEKLLTQTQAHGFLLLEKNRLKLQCRYIQRIGTNVAAAFLVCICAEWANCRKAES